MVEKIKQLADKYFNDFVEIRRHIHMFPELSFEEFKTTDFIISVLEIHKIRYISRSSGTGLTVVVEGKNPGKNVIALKADIDALPVSEKNEVAYKSLNPGVMHACGHDYNAATLLGTAIILNEIREEFEGTVKLIFQPGEEKLPGGAREMIDEGVLKNPTVSVVIAQHCLPELEVGKAGFRQGNYMASTDEIYITVKGKGGHGAMPGSFTDSILTASHIIVALQQIASRYAPPDIPTVLSFGRIRGDGSTNVIPEEVKIEGTFRTMDAEWRERAHSRIRKIAGEIARSMDAECEVLIIKGYPVLHNDDDLTLRVKNIAEKYLGSDNIVELKTRMTSDDFAYYSQVLPSVYFRTGVGNISKNFVPQLHTSTFNIDEDALKISTGLMSWVAFSLLNK